MYYFRNILERASARETAARVAVGAVCRELLKEFGINIYSYVESIGKISAKLSGIDKSKIQHLAEMSFVRCPDKIASKKMIQVIRQANSKGDTLGGKFEVIFGNLPIGLGSYAQWDTMLDGKLAQAVMSIPGVKAVEVGAGVDSAYLKGSQMHDELFVDKNQKIYRQTNNAGGIEGGITNGETLIIKGTMKPIPTMKKEGKDTTEIVSGGAKGIDTIAKEYAMSNNIKYTEFLPRVVRDILPDRASEFTAVSKYVLCYEKTEYMNNLSKYWFDN